MKYPWEYGVLRKIIKGSIGKDIDFVDVMDIRDLSIAPRMSEI